MRGKCPDLNGCHKKLLPRSRRERGFGACVSSRLDREAVKLLALLQSNGAELSNCPAYIREWVTRERAKGRKSDA